MSEMFGTSQWLLCIHGLACAANEKLSRRALDDCLASKMMFASGLPIDFQPYSFTCSAGDSLKPLAYNCT